jgi:hypothetical protein
MADIVALERDEVLACVRARVRAAVGAWASAAEAEDVAQQAFQLLSTTYADLAPSEELVAIGAQIAAARRRARGETPAPLRDSNQLLPGAALDSAARAERSERLRAALEDQALFDALVEEEGRREPPTVWERLRAWYERPATLIDLGVLFALGAAAIAGYAHLTPPIGPGVESRELARPMGAPLSPQHVAWLLGLPEQQVVPAGIEIMGRTGVFAPGETLQLRITFRAPARVAVLADSTAGPRAQAWPGLGQPPALVSLRSTGGPAMLPVVVEASPGEGTHRLRLVVAPADLDLGALAPDALARAAGRLTLVDLRYQVRPN